MKYLWKGNIKVKIKRILIFTALCIAAFLLGILIGKVSVRNTHPLEVVSKVTPYTYIDPDGNEIIYYCCQTVDETNTELSADAIDLYTVGSVVNFADADSYRECQVNGRLAILCQVESKMFLCWSLTSELSCVIEYTDGTVSEDDIFRMAESVPLPERKE